MAIAPSSYRECCRPYALILIVTKSITQTPHSSDTFARLIGSSRYHKSMLDPDLQNQLTYTERQFIPDEYRRRLICKPTDFSSFKSPALRASVDIPIVVALKGSRFVGTVKSLYLDGYDAELEIPARSATNATSLEPSAVKLIGSRATIKGRDKSPTSHLIAVHSVEVTIVRRTSETRVVIRMKDLDLPAKRYAQRLAFLLDTDAPHADRTT